MKKRAGFTIVELLIVIVVIAILASITLVSYSGVTGRAHDTAVLSDLQNLQSSLELYRQTNNTYPSQSSITDIMTEITTNGPVKMKFSTTSYASPDIYPSYPSSTIMVGYTSTNPRNLCFVIKSKSGQDYVYATDGAMAKTAPITAMGGAHDFKAACSTDGAMPDASSVTYGPVTL